MNLNKDKREHVFKQWNPFQRTVLISLFITLCVLCMTTISSAVSIRVLILDNEGHKTWWPEKRWKVISSQKNIKNLDIEVKLA